MKTYVLKSLFELSEIADRQRRERSKPEKPVDWAHEEKKSEIVEFFSKDASGDQGRPGGQERGMSATGDSQLG